MLDILVIEVRNKCVNFTCGWYFNNLASGIQFFKGGNCTRNTRTRGHGVGALTSFAMPANLSFAHTSMNVCLAAATFADQAVIAIENARLVDQECRGLTTCPWAGGRAVAARSSRVEVPWAASCRYAT